MMRQGAGWTLYKADVMGWAAAYDGPPCHALLADPPYELGFMGKKWDRSGIAFRPETWAALAAHLLPGAFLMCFASSRGWHRQAVAMEDAGLIMHPSIFGWGFGSGFPKATRIDTQIDAAAGMEREVVGEKLSPDGIPYSARKKTFQTNGSNEGWRRPSDANARTQITAPATPLAAAWQGHRYGLQALKPALEPILVFQKPYAGRPLDSIMATGAGAINVDGGRIETDWNTDPTRRGWQGGNTSTNFDGGSIPIHPGSTPGHKRVSQPNTQGRWPANLLLSEEAAQRLDEMSGERRSSNPAGSTSWSKGKGTTGHEGWQRPAHESYKPTEFEGYQDSGGSSRFFYTVSDAIDAADPLYYCAKASRGEREAGLNDFDAKRRNTMSEFVRPSEGRTANKASGGATSNPHPTVKPLDLVRYLSLLLLPPAEYAPRRLLVPFAGVGSEMIGARLAGWDEVIGVEKDDEDQYIQIAEARLRYWTGKRLERVAGRVEDYSDLGLFAAMAE